jgi:CRP-like cAMP-binding protein
MREGSAGDIAGASLERKQTRFTELEFEDPDSLLGVIEAAAGVPASSPSVEIVFEEPILAPMPDARPVPRTPLFSDLPESAFVALFERCPLRRFAENEIILEQGSAATSFFIICQGAVRVVRQEGTHRRELAKLEEGAFFGEMALLSEAPRTANVIAATDETQALEISAAILTELSQEHPSVAVALKQFCRQRLLSNLLASAPLFKPFTGSERRALIERFRARDAAPGEVLIREGQPSDGLYVLLTGEVSVTAQGAPLATLREGHVFGEMSLLLRAPTNATITTTRRTSFLRLPKADFDQLIMSHPQILELVAELAHERQRQNTIAAPVAPRVTDTMV